MDDLTLRKNHGWHDDDNKEKLWMTWQLGKIMDDITIRKNHG